MSKDKKAPAKTEDPKPAAVEAKVAEPKAEYVTSTQLAEKLGTKGTILRRWLRTLPQFQDAGYTRYKWDPTDAKDAQFLKDAETSFKKHQTADSEKKEKRLEEAREKQEAKKKAAEAGEPVVKKDKKKKEEKPAEPEESEEDDDFEDDEEGEDIE